MQNCCGWLNYCWCVKIIWNRDIGRHGGLAFGREWNGDMLYFSWGTCRKWRQGGRSSWLRFGKKLPRIVIKVNRWIRYDLNTFVCSCHNIFIQEFTPSKGTDCPLWLVLLAILLVGIFEENILIGECTINSSLNLTRYDMRIQIQSNISVCFRRGPVPFRLLE